MINLDTPDPSKQIFIMANERGQKNTPMDAPFLRILRPPFGPNLDTAEDWWLAGGIPAANCFAAYQPESAVSYAASKVNLANPGTYNATEGAAPDWDAVNGWKFNGSSYYLTTGLSSGSGYSMIIKFTNASVNGGMLAGMQYGGSGDRFYLRPVEGGSHRYGYGNSSTTAAGAANNGVMALTPTKGFLNGLQDATLTGTLTNNQTIFIGCYSGSSGNPAYYTDADIQAIAIYDIDISAYISALTTAMNHI